MMMMITDSVKKTARRLRVVSDSWASHLRAAVN